MRFGKQLFPVGGKNAPIPTERPRYGQRGPYCLDLGAVASTPTKVQKPAKKQPTKAEVVASTSLVLTVSIQKELSRKVESKLSDQMSLEFILLRISHFRAHWHCHNQPPSPRT